MAHSWALNVLNCIKMQRITKQITLIACFKLGTSNKNYTIVNESIYVYINVTVTSLYLHSLVYIS